MRLHRLEIEAFGPFAGRQTVDFDALSAAGLFLLHGATGAGKTSVLDAICFALYGAVPGARGRGARLRSDHAAPGLPPRVCLELTVAGRRLEVTRSPAWERPKRRGQGVTVEPASTVVRELIDGQWVGRTSRNDEAAHLLQAVTGMSLAQFTQVVMLPQGEFAEFLRADAETRRPLLQRLFGTDRFADLETWLADLRRVLDRQIEQVDREVDALLARAAEASGTGQPDPSQPDPSGEQPAQDVAALLARAETELSQAAEEAARASAASTEAAGELSTARALAERAGRWLAARDRMRELDALSEQRDRRVGELEAARSAASLDAQFQALGEAETEQRALAEHARSLAGQTFRLCAELGLDPLDSPGASGASGASGTRGASGASGTPGASGASGASGADLAEPGAGASTAALRRLARMAREQLMALAELARDADERAGLLSEVHRLQAEISVARREREELAGRLAELPAHSRRLEEQRHAARAATAAIPAASETVARAQRRSLAATGLAQARDRLTAAELARTAAVDAAQSSRADWLDLRERRLTGMAGELAGLLEPASPCPVCGSTEHPAPARAAANSVRAEDERAALARLQAAETAREQAEATVGELASRVAELAALAAGPDGVALSAEAAQAELAAAQEAARAAQEAAGRLGELEQLVADAERILADTRTGLSERERTLAQLGERVAGLITRAQQLTTALDAALGPGVDPVQRAGQVEQLAVAAEEAADALARAGTSAAQVEVLRRTLAVAGAQAGFPDLPAALSARRCAEELVELEGWLRGHEQAKAAAAAVLADPALCSAAEQPAPDLDALAERATGLAEQARLAGLAEHTARTRLSALRRIAAELDELARTAQPLRERAELVRGLSRLAEGTGGGNTRRMRLSSFVLAARLEAVAAAATTRLLAMSAGRYALVHTDETDGRGRSGLGLRVVDAWTGAERDTTTLSGGESFYASLALALGLADVVTAEAGGALVDTLFVDEGFGSLDEDSLDEVMDTLDGLRDGGRAVGVVSHVADMRARIPAQLQVFKGRGGSRLRLSGVAQA